MKLKNFRSSKFVILTLSFVAAIFACCFTIAFSNNALANPYNDEFHPITLNASQEVTVYAETMESEPISETSIFTLPETESNHWSNLYMRSFKDTEEYGDYIWSEIKFTCNGTEKTYFAMYVKREPKNDPTDRLFIKNNDETIASLSEGSEFVSENEFNLSVEGDHVDGGVYVDFTHIPFSANGHVEFSGLTGAPIETGYFSPELELGNMYLSINSDNSIIFANNNIGYSINYKAVADAGYELDEWYYITKTDGESSQPVKLIQGDNIILIDYDTSTVVSSVYPTFKPVAPTTYSVTFNVLNPEAGKIVDSAGTEVSMIGVNENSTVTVSENTITFADATANESQTYTAMANDGYEFESWGEVPATISAATTISASFKASEPQPTPDPENPGTGGSEENANETVQTGDYLATVLCGLGFIAAAAGIALIIRKRKLN